MPVHINDKHVGRHSAVLELVCNLEELIIGICPIAAPPVAQSIFRRHGNLSGDSRKVLKRTGIVVPIGKDIKVLSIASRPLADPFAPVRTVLLQKMPFALIDYCPSVTGQNAVLELFDRGCFRILIETSFFLVSRVDAVERTHSALEVAVCRKSGMPDDILSVQFEADRKVVLVKAVVAAVAQSDSTGFDEQGTVGRP